MTVAGSVSGAFLAAALVVLGVWATAFMDKLIGGLVAGRGLHLEGAAIVPLRDGIRLLFQEFRKTERPDLALWLGAPVLLVTIVMTSLAVFPLAPDVVGADISVGIVYFTAIWALTLVAVFAAAWGANSKYALLAGYRFIGLMLAYEMPLAITIIAVALPAESLRLTAIVAIQQTTLWNALLQPLGFLIYLLSALGVAFWGPFRIVDSDDLAGGVEAELSGAPRLLWRFGHYGLMLTTAAFAVPLFLGGGAGPWLPDAAWTLLKVVAVLTVLLWVSHVSPRWPLDRFMKTAWIALIPLSLINLLLIGLGMLLFPDFFGGR